MPEPYYVDDQVSVYHGDCLDVMADLPDASVDAVITDPPYGLDFMGKHWDTGAVAFHIDTWLHCLRLLKPGGHLLAFGGTRTWHRLTCAVEDAGFEIRDSIAWLYGSGFPKSLDVSKAIDKTAGAEREVVGRGSSGIAKGSDDRNFAHGKRAQLYDAQTEFDITAPATDAAKQWQGWGTALKPAFEPLVVARKPMRGTVAANVVEHGTGALNIDACRVHGEDAPEGRLRHGGGSAVSGSMSGPLNPDVRPASPAGRWPTNVVIDETTAAAIDKDSGITRDGVAVNRNRNQSSSRSTIGPVGHDNRKPRQDLGYGGEGGASRFFPTFKHDESEQQCTEIPTTDDSTSSATDAAAAPKSMTEKTHAAGDYDTSRDAILTRADFPTFKYQAKADTAQRPTANGIAHPTVKPLDLMRWLVRLVTPPNGVVLDPFAGSGTTAEACVHEYKRCITIEREPDYLPLIVARLSKPMAVGFDFDGGAA